MIFVLIFFSISALLAGYTTWRLFSGAHLTRRWKFAIGALFAGVIFLTPLTIMLRRYGFQNTGVDLLVWIAYLGLGFLSFVFTLVIVRDLIRFGHWSMGKARPLLSRPRQKLHQQDLPENPERRGFLVQSMNAGIFAGALVFTGYGIASARVIPGVKEVPVFLHNLPPSLEGFTIVQITDLHVGHTIRRPFVEAVVHAMNDLNADLVALTGDVVDGPVSRFGWDVEPLARVRAAKGKFFVTGNHEYYVGVGPWMETFRRMGFSVLLNDHRLITKREGRMLIAGVTDYRAGRMVPGHQSDPRKAFANAPPADVRILLAHQPRSIFEAVKEGYDLQISGHTHGGQFFPWNLVVGLVEPFLAGLYHHEGAQLYVSRGTGTWGPPVRVGSPSEITLIRLHRKVDGV